MDRRTRSRNGQALVETSLALVVVVLTIALGAAVAMQTLRAFKHDFVVKRAMARTSKYTEELEMQTEKMMEDLVNTTKAQSRHTKNKADKFGGEVMDTDVSDLGTR